MGDKESLFIKSWSIVKKHQILFLPNIFVLITNLVLLILFLKISGVWNALLNNQQVILKDSLASWKFVLLFAIYMLINGLVDNFFFTAKYGMIKDVLLRNKTSLAKGWKFAKKYYWTTLSIHVLSILIIAVPIIILVVLMLSLLPVSPMAAVTIFIPLLIAYTTYILIRLIFIYPVMAFEKKGAYKSLEDDFHFVKTHFSHTFVTWLVLMVVLIFASVIRQNVIALSSLLSGQIFFIGLLVVTLIIAIEMLVSVWEHVYIFKSYLSVRKRRKR